MAFVLVGLNCELKMGLPSFLLSFFLVFHLLPCSVSPCPSFDCERCPIKFPFTNDTYPLCEWCLLRCDELVPKVVLGEQGTSYQVSAIYNNTIKISDQRLKHRIESKDCHIFSDIIPPNTPSIFTISTNLTFFKCNTNSPAIDDQKDKHFFDNYTSYTGEDCKEHTVYYSYPNNTVPTHYPGNCEFFQLPVVSSAGRRNQSDPFSLLTSNFSVEYHLLFPSLSPPISPSSNVPKEKGRSHLGLILGIVIPGVILPCFVLVILYRKKWRNYFSSHTIWRNTSSDRFSREDLEEGSVFFGIPVFSFSELKEATHNFDPFKELGDGGFGTVYHGKLQDGREVAVKRLYQHNYKRVAQFLNEIEILTHLRHPNLVTLYGCTSRHSRELLLVYEYIPNGTVADHLHGDRAKDHPLPWPIRMNIAIETASALVYLHASDIIHRDVKTNNILLDNNFCVKVADFGLSRLFPTDVSHVSTAPQGTPGYVDPDYRQCYQLTVKSDVYSFGVVLMELISSLPAVDISRHRHEINLANLAISRIQEGAFKELIDPSLGFNSDSSVERMTTSVAEVAFRCLQLEKEMRPRMNEVLEALKKIQEYKDDEIGEMPPPSPDRDNAELLNSSKVPPSQDSVTN